MITLRRSSHEMRIEIMPLIDVIFLLLTFFIYAMVLMVRAEMLPITMQEFASGEPAEPGPVITITIDAAGTLYVDREEVPIEGVLERLQAAKTRDPDTVVWIAADATGSTDRLPTFLDLYDRLAFAGLDIRLVGLPPDEGKDSP